MTKYVLFRTEVGTPEMRPIEAFGEVVEGTEDHIPLDADQALFHPLDEFPNGWTASSGDEWSAYSLDSSDGTIEARPVLDPLPAGTAPHTINMSTLPTGAEVTAINELGDTVVTDDPSDPIVLPESGTFQVRIVAGFPWLPLEQTLEVTDA